MKGLFERLIVLPLFFLVLGIVVLPFSQAVSVAFNEQGVLTSGPNIVRTSILFFGSENQERLNNVEARVSFTNLGNQTINITRVESSLASQFGLNDATLSTPLVIAPGSTESLTLQADIPLEFSAVNRDGKQDKENIGLVNYRGTVGSDALLIETPVFMQAVNQLEPELVRVLVNGEFNEVKDGDIIQGISPGDEIKVDVEVKNHFNTESSAGQGISNIIIKDVSLEVEIDDKDLSLKENVDFDDIKAGEKQRDAIKFDLPSDTPSGSFVMRLQVIGEDDNGAEHGFRYDVTLQIAKQNHDLSFQDIKVEPRTVQCDRDVVMSFTLVNIGRSREDEGKIVLESQALGIFQKVENISLAEGKSKEYEFKVHIPENTRQGTYILNLMSFYRHKYQLDQKNIDLDVFPCDGTAPDLLGNADDNDPNTLPPPRVVTVVSDASQNNANDQTNLSEQSSESLLDNSLWLWLIIAGLFFVLVIAVLVVLFVKFR